jgi:nuclear protein localization protein 4 homolog
MDHALLQNSAAAPLFYDPAATPTSFCLANDAFIYRLVRASPSPKALSVVGSFRRKMTMDDLTTHQIRCTRREATLRFTASFDHDAANTFRLNIAESLAFAVKRAKFL